MCGWLQFGRWPVLFIHCVGWYQRGRFAQTFNCPPSKDLAFNGWHCFDCHPCFSLWCALSMYHLLSRLKDILQKRSVFFCQFIYVFLSSCRLFQVLLSRTKKKTEQCVANTGCLFDRLIHYNCFVFFVKAMACALCYCPNNEQMWTNALQTYCVII